MKKFMKSIQMMAALLLAVAATTACSKDDNAIDETTPATTGAPKTYTLTVTASKGGEATTRALSIDGMGALNAKWTKGDAIRVMKLREMPGNVEFALLGTLKATTVSADGLTATFTGSLDADKVTAADGLAEGDKLVLGYLGTNLGSSTSAFELNYNGQDGTLEKIATNYDYCMTSTSKSKMVTVESVDATTGEVTTSGTASFTNQQAIVRFTLYESDGETPFCPTSLDITAVGLVQSVDVPESGIAPAPSEQTLTLTPDGSTNVIYAALRGISGQTVKLRAWNGDKYLNYTTNSAVTFTRGKFYDVKVKMYKTTDLATVSGDYTASDYEMLTGELHSGNHVTIPNGATVTLAGVNISASNSGIICKGTANIILTGTNIVTTTSYSEPSIQAGGSGKMLTISGRGNLIATAGSTGAGIGSGHIDNCGDISITGGTVTATGVYGAGIGSGQEGSCGKITITGGTVRATGGGGAGIGSGYQGSCGVISITGGTVKATSGSGAGIGSGASGSCAKITITDDVSSVTASKDDDGACSIGRGYNGYCDMVIIGDMGYYDGTRFYNGGETYLATSPLVYKPEKQTESNQQ